MNKKGYYRLADIGMFFLCFLIVALGIVIGIYMFYSNTVDIRDQEANILLEKVEAAIAENRQLNQKILEENFNILEEAGLNSKIINEYYYFKIEVFENGNLLKKIEGGNRDFDVECGLNGEKFPKCREKEFDTDGNYKIKILTGSNQLIALVILKIKS
ncbi:MAG: hypothetical protein AABX77_02840 [Nanoarchaeota archaeon]